MEVDAPRIGTAGWSIRSEFRDAFPQAGSHLERYAARFNMVEINSSFYHPHRRSTYARWADTVGDAFRFAVKLPRTISHAGFAEDLAPLIARFAEEVTGLGAKLGMVLVQFPPSLGYDETRASQLLAAIGASLPCRLACEPRHASWFDGRADALLERLRVARVAADPALVPHAGKPGGWLATRYRRLHGSPKIYYSDYDADELDRLSAMLAAEVADGVESWCVFDNTALGHATTNALRLSALVGPGRGNNARRGVMGS